MEAVRWPQKTAALSPLVLLQAMASEHATGMCGQLPCSMQEMELHGQESPTTLAQVSARALALLKCSIALASPRALPSSPGRVSTSPRPLGRPG